MSDVPLERMLRRKGGTAWICHTSNTTVTPTQDGHTLLNPYVSCYGRRRRRRQKRQTYSTSHSSVSCRYLVTRYHVSLTCHSTMIGYPCSCSFWAAFCAPSYHLLNIIWCRPPPRSWSHQPFCLPTNLPSETDLRSPLSGMASCRSGHHLRKDHRFACHLSSRVISASNGHSVDMV